MQEWCGHVYAQWLTRTGRIEETLHSYWDGEADREQSYGIPAGAIFGDALPMLARGFTGDRLKPGGSVEVPYLERMLDVRLGRRRPSFQTATLSRSEPVNRTTVLGEMSAETFRVDYGPDKWVELWVEAHGARRLLGWQTSAGERAKLTGSTRAPYWTQSAPSDESLRRLLGLTVD